MNTATGHGKCIVTGEHSVVYGYPAVVCELDKGITVTVQNDSKIQQKHPGYITHILEVFSHACAADTSKVSVQVSSDLPQNSGLGSSAALAYALAQALAKQNNIILTKDEFFKIVYDCEVFVHKKPSGIDPCAVVYGGVHEFQKLIETGEFKKQKLQVMQPHSFILVNSGTATENTGEMIALVSESLSLRPRLRNVLERIGCISQKISNQLQHGVLDGSLLDENQEQLEVLGVVGDQAKKMIAKLKSVGAHAKITGAGGVRSGSGWILVYAPNLSEIEAFCTQNAWEMIKTEVK